MLAEGEAVAVADTPGEAVEEFAGDLGDLAAALAGQVAVVGGGQVVGGGPAADAGAVDEAEAGELVEVAVDGGPVGAGRADLDGGGELVGAAVGAVLG